MSGSEQRSRSLADFLPYQLSIASNAVSERIAAAYRSRFGLKVAEWRVMAVLGDAEIAGTSGATQRDLTAVTLMDKVAVNRACKALAERGLIERRPNVTDGRSHHLALTKDGENMHAEIMPLAQEMERQLFAGLSPKECANFRQLLDRVRAQAGTLGGSSS